MPWVGECEKRIQAGNRDRNAERMRASAAADWDRESVGASQEGRGSMSNCKFIGVWLWPNQLSSLEM